jgi:hypothetical protein
VASAIVIKAEKRNVRNDQRTSDQQKKFMAVRADAKECARSKIEMSDRNQGRKVRVTMYLRIDAMNVEGEYDILR